MGRLIDPYTKANLLIQFVNENKRLPKQNEEYDSLKIGSFWNDIKNGRQHQIYVNILSKNNIIKATYDKHLENKGGKDKLLSPVEKANSILKFVEENKRVPKYEEEYNCEKVGIFWSSFKQGRNPHIYNTFLSKNNILKKSYEKYLSKKASIVVVENKVVYSSEEKVKMLIK